MHISDSHCFSLAHATIYKETVSHQCRLKFLCPVLSCICLFIITQILNINYRLFGLQYRLIPTKSYIYINPFLLSTHRLVAVAFTSLLSSCFFGQLSHVYLHFPFLLHVFCLTFLPGYILLNYMPEHLLLSISESKIYSQCTEGLSQST